MADLKYWLWLTTRKGLGAVGALTVLDYFSNPERAFYGGKEDYAPLPLPNFAKQALLDKSMDGPNRIMGECDRLGLHIMTIEDTYYPQRLRQISDPPVLLYIRGKIFRFDEEAAIGVVGMRRATVKGLERAEKFSMDLSAKGALVVSGIAEGIDTFAVTGALKAGGPVVSMLAGGVDQVFPKENRYLYEDVAAAGALISEYPPGTPHRGEHFNPRNRILSGLCLGVLAVECEPRGGTMLTVNHALEQGREVYAVPIGLDENCARGTNRLIQDYKAKLVERAEDILEDFAGQFPTKLKGVPLPPEVVRARLAGDKPRKEAPVEPAVKAAPSRELIPRGEQKSQFTDDELAILAATSEDTLTTDEIVDKTQIPAKRVWSALTILQIGGKIEEHPGRRFCSLVKLE